MKRLLSALLALCLILTSSIAMAAGQGLPLQDCHKVTLTKTDTKQSNKSVVRLWKADTVLDSVDAELASITTRWAEEIGPDLPKAINAGDKNSRLDVEIRYSRTGMTWMSFLLLARTSFHRALTAQQMTTRTYDMTTGERIWLTDIFPEDSEVWTLLADRVREGVNGYFPDEEPDPEAVEELVSMESLRKLDFSLHGMSMILHIPAWDFYAGRQTLMQITLMYPEIRPYMTAKAQEETDNGTYYKFCAITFDDGPARTNTTSVLNNLMETGISATFFVIGNRVAQYADLVQREHDEGHAVGSHNWHHGNVQKSKGSALRAMKGKVDKVMYDAIGITVRYDRVPYGLYNQMIKAKVGWPLIQWSLDTYDWRGRSSKTVLNTVLKQISDGDIILCHDIKDHTPTSAKLIANELQAKGYMFLTVDEMFAKDGVELKPDVVYFRCKDGVTSIKKK